MARWFALSAGALVLLGGAACGARREPPRPVADDFVAVEYPPPPAQVEEMSEELAGRPECIWQDGHYEWSGRRYRWIAGEWIVPPPGCAYAPAALTWSRTSPARLYYTPPRWYRTDADWLPAGENSETSRPAPCALPIPCLTRPSAPP